MPSPRWPTTLPNTPRVRADGALVAAAIPPQRYPVRASSGQTLTGHQVVIVTPTTIFYGWVALSAVFTDDDGVDRVWVVASPTVHADPAPGGVLSVWADPIGDPIAMNADQVFTEVPDPTSGLDEPCL